MVCAVILAAGFGSRLGYDMPKALIDWDDQKIIDHQIGRLRDAGVQDIIVVVGFQADRVRNHVQARWDGVTFVENPAFMDTNTAKSLRIGLEAAPPGDVVWLNGDVVFDAKVIQAVVDAEGETVLAVDDKVCGDEEVKYRIRHGRLTALSKEAHGDGEAVGINRVAAADREHFMRALDYVEDQAYFERALEHLLPFTERPVRCIHIGDLRAMEIDFPEDLEAAREMFGK